ncbi:hypothetical protein F2Q69_00014466 [Brassica cretica]|uniref:Uncharacterized protein n=1 Tax=Brassica cretica TaxID=69181 RepID=A0A8S9QXH4_BRACR|nr:hypothetical protein F2Q69_00014466 [Brassica cretica]
MIIHGLLRSYGNPQIVGDDSRLERPKTLHNFAISNLKCGSQRGRLKCKKIESMSGRGDHRHRISASEILWFLCFVPVSVSLNTRAAASSITGGPQDIVTLVLSWHMNAAGTSSCEFFGGLQALGPDFLIAPIGKLQKTLSFNYENKNLRKKLVAEEHEIHCLWPLD